MYQVRTQNHPEYEAGKTEEENKTIEQALFILRDRMKEPGQVMSKNTTVQDFLKIHLSHVEHEVFSILFLDNQHRLISFDELFRGTINGAGVYPREVVKEAIKHNAAAVIFAHNHPSGIPDPSSADRHITKQLQEALSLIDVRTLDHIVIGGTDAFSFAEAGYI